MHIAHMCFSIAFLLLFEYCMCKCRRILHVKRINFLELINSLPCKPTNILFDSSPKTFTQNGKMHKNEQLLSWIVALYIFGSMVEFPFHWRWLSNNICVCVCSASSLFLFHSIRLPISIESLNLRLCIWANLWPIC